MDTKEARWACMLTRALYINLEQIIIKIKLVPIGLLPLALLCKEFEVEERQRPLGALGHRSTLRAELMVCFLGFKQFTKLDDFSMDSLFGTIVYAEFTQL